MVTQKLTIRLDETELPEIRMVSGDIGREIQIEVYAREDSDTPIDLETYSADITLIKPDNTFIMDHFNVDKYELPENAGAVSGSGYYQIKIYTAGTHHIYTGQGRFLVDDMILSDDVIESSSIAFGDRFPEDFATKEWVDDEIEAAVIGTYVAGNPAGEETMPPLVRLQINDDIYPISHKIEEMEDADITAPAEGDVLTYDADDQKWKNEPIDIPDPTVTKTVSGNPIEISDGADAPLVKCVTQITGYQEGSGTPSPDNIRPIVAYTEGEIEVRGKNLLESNVISQTKEGVTFVVNSDGSITANGTASAPFTIELHSYQKLSDYGITAEPYTISGKYGTSTAYLMLGILGSGREFRDTTGNGFSFTPTEAELEKNYRTILVFANGAVLNNATFYPMIETGSSATDYEPYTSTTHTATYSQSIYQGNADFVGGKARATWGYIASYNGETLPGEWISSMDEYAPGTTPTTGAQVAYELAAPTTTSITVSNAPVKSLSGYNHIESTTGEMEVEYITQQWDAIMKAAQLDNMKVYSTAEQVVGKWIDGSDIFERTIDIGSFSVSSWEDHTIESSTNINLLIDYDGYMVESNIIYALPDPSVRIKVDASHNLIFTGTSSWNVTSGYITIKYIKL